VYYASIEECLGGLDILMSFFTTKGGFTCECTDGYTLSYDGMNCDDVDECKQSSCPPPGLCENSYGSYTCTCPDGFKLTSTGNECIDVNECTENPDFCSNGFCQNQDGSADCQCAGGWTLSPDGSKCIDNRMEPCFNDNYCSKTSR
jgi:hypothetical protein